MTSYGTGAAGGIFAPLLLLGALLGLGVGRVTQIFMPALAADPGVFAVVGMAAYFTAIVRAPLTGILLISEMTGSYEQMLPLLAASFCAYGVTEYLKDMPIYEALLKRDLARAGISSGHAEPIIVEFEVEPNFALCRHDGARTGIAGRLCDPALPCRRTRVGTDGGDLFGALHASYRGHRA